ncbi:MAG: ABC transporter permease subunit [Bacillota bacterium]|nr:ABC transporter permease subunit [Bacillota bacterium]
MSNLVPLLLGELQRMKRYHILGASLVVALIWIGVMQLSGVQDVSRLFPLLVMLDATSMAILLIGVTLFFEKQEGTMKTLMVSPISRGEYILSKILANIVSNLVTLVFLYTYALLFKEININILGLTAAVILIAFFHSLIGVMITFYSKDFAELLIGMMKYFFLLMLPVLLEQLGIINNDVIKKLLYTIPTKASMILLNAAVGGINLGEILLATVYLIVASIGLYVTVLKKFYEFSMKESGV